MSIAYYNDIDKGWLTREADRLSTVRHDGINLERYITASAMEAK